MQSSTSKKVVVCRFDREPIAGFVQPVAFQMADSIEVLLASGVVQRVPYPEIKYVAFVKDFDPARALPEQRVFQSRPKLDGLWVRLEFRDGEMQEGVLANNLAVLDPAGCTVTPPNSTGNIQRMFVPRQALLAVTVLAVMGQRSGGKAERPAGKRKRQVADEQGSLFALPPPA